MRLQRKNSVHSPITADELLDAMATTKSFSHLQVIMRHQPDAGTLPQQFLMVTPNNFGKVNLVDMQYRNEYVILYLQNLITKKSFEARINIYDTSFKFLLINWQDVAELLRVDGQDPGISDALFELDA